MSALVDELKRRGDGLLLITYEHTTDASDNDGGVWIHGSPTVIRGLRECLIEELDRALYDGGSNEDPEDSVE